MLEGTCAYCNRDVHFTARTGWVRSRLTRQAVGSTGTTRYEHELEIAATCDNCKRFNTALGRRSTGGSDALQQGTVLNSSAAVTFGEVMTVESWHPPLLVTAGTAFVPEGVAGYFQEAHDAMSVGAQRAVLLLVRSVIEATARDKGIAKGTLVEKINALHERGHVRAGVRDMAHVLRIFGNDAAHGEIDVVPTAEDAQDALTIARFVLDDVYVADARRADMMDRRKSKE